VFQEAQGQAPSHPGSNGVDLAGETLEKIEKMRRKIIAELDSVGVLNMSNSWNSAFWAAKTRRCNNQITKSVAQHSDVASGTAPAGALFGPGVKENKPEVLSAVEAVVFTLFTTIG